MVDRRTSVNTSCSSLPSFAVSLSTCIIEEDQPRPNAIPSGQHGKASRKKNEKKVTISTSANTLLAYENEEWESESEDAGRMPEILSGLLWKKSPSAFGQYQQRYFLLEDGRLTWWNSRADAWDKNKIKGCVDFEFNASRLVSTDSGSKFELEPKDGKWCGRCNFTKSKEGRSFEFDAAGSKHTRAAWIRAIEAHQAYAISAPRKVRNVACAAIS